MKRVQFYASDAAESITETLISIRKDYLICFSADGLRTLVLRITKIIDCNPFSERYPKVGNYVIPNNKISFAWELDHASL